MTAFLPVPRPPRSTSSTWADRGLRGRRERCSKEPTAGAINVRREATFKPETEAAFNYGSLGCVRRRFDSGPLTAGRRRL